MKYEKQIIKYWYETLPFPKEFDAEFYELLQNTEIDPKMTISDYDIDSKDGKKNLLYFLYFCEDAKKKYTEMGIDEKCLIDTLSDIVCYTKLWTEVKGTLHLEELYWLKRHLTLNIFALGRLQFAFGKAEHTNNDLKFTKGENILEVHIPEGDTFSLSEILDSFRKSKEFFAKFFPEFKYSFYTCDSWLLGYPANTILKETSNIKKFAKLFDVFHYTENDYILRYLFKWDTERKTLENEIATSSFSQNVKNLAVKGETFTEGYGIINLNSPKIQ